MDALVSPASHRATRPGPQPSAAALSVQFVADVDGLAQLRPHYERLQQVTGNTLPFALLDWHLSWCAHFLMLNRRVQRTPLVCLMRNDRGECVALFPLVVNRPRLGPFNLTMVNLLGADDSLTEIRSPLVEPGYEHASLNTLRRCLSQACNWDWIQWTGISSALAQAMPADVQHHPRETRDDYVLDLPPDWQQFHARLRRNVRESLRHCYNSLRRDGHAFEFVVARGSGEIQSALDRFLQLHTLRAQMPWGPKHPDRFKDPAARAFLYDVCDRLAARDVARVFQLKIGGQIVAARVGFAVADSLYLYYSGFDPRWARYSVMTTTLAETLKYAIRAGLRTVNLSPTAEQSKLRWRPRVVLFQSARLPRGKFGSHAAYFAYWVARSGARAAAGRLSRRS